MKMYRLISLCTKYINSNDDLLVHAQKKRKKLNKIKRSKIASLD